MTKEMNIPYEIAVKGNQEIKKYIEQQKLREIAREKQKVIADAAHVVLKRIHETTNQYPFKHFHEYNEWFSLAYRPEKIWRIVQSLKNDVNELEQYTIDLIDNKRKFEFE